IDALEPDLALAEIGLDTIEPAEEVIVPERTPEFTVGDGLEANIFLLPDDGRDFPVLDRLQRVGRNLAVLVLYASLFQRRSAQQAADMIGAERRTVTQRHERRLAAPHLVRQLHDHPQFRPLLVLSQ